jgi:hypothetical protein
MAVGITNASMGSGIPLCYGFVHVTGMRFVEFTGPTPKWQAGHVYTITALLTPCILDSNGNLQIVHTSGTSGGSEPTNWAQDLHHLTSGDGSMVWQNWGGGQDGAEIGLWLLGEGEWDGFNSLYNQGTAPMGVIASNYGYAGRGSYWSHGPSPAVIHFHAGCDTPTGSLVTPTSSGPDQLCDSFWSQLPGGVVPLTYSRMAYYAMQWTPPFYQLGDTLNPIGQWRSLKCRIFDDTGTQVDYAFTTNPAWHWVDAWLRRAIFQTTDYSIDIDIGIQSLPDAALNKFDWGSIYEFSQDCDYILANGRKRFEGSYAFPGQTTLAAILEQILTCSRGYQQESAGKLFVAMDKPRASVFILTSQHLIPGTFKMDDKTVHQGANDYTASFLDINIPAITDIATIDNVAGGYTGDDGTGDLATIVTVEKSPVAALDQIYIGGNSNSLLNFMWLVQTITDDYTFTARPQGDVGDQTGTGGVLGFPQARFSKRTPRLLHQQHAAARGQIGP